MVDELGTVDEAKLLAETDDLISSWSTVRAKQQPTRSPSPKHLTEYSWMLGGKHIPLGFTNPDPLGPPAEAAGPSTPSETLPNV
jgi:hypothetical protein